MVKDLIVSHAAMLVYLWYVNETKLLTLHFCPHGDLRSYVEDAVAVATNLLRRGWNKWISWAWRRDSVRVANYLMGKKDNNES